MKMYSKNKLKVKSILILIVLSIFLFNLRISVQAACICIGGAHDGKCVDDEECEAEYGKCGLACRKEEPDEGGVNIFSEGAEWLFGDEGLTLSILKPSRLMKMEGTASFWSLVAYISSVLWWFVLVAFFFAVGIGAIRWISSQGQEAKLQSAKKWLVNAVVGFSATIAVFLIANFITWLIGIGGVFDLAKNLAVCGEGDDKEVLFEWKKEHDMMDATDCTCNYKGWSCSK